MKKLTVLAIAAVALATAAGSSQAARAYATKVAFRASQSTSPAPQAVRMTRYYR